ncbi:MAG TPA: hypothetical protein VND65_03915 [Candidatus Binatia bacterium]|nr:hypothetical protein [Candidatus Binatia bacterium]
MRYEKPEILWRGSALASVQGGSIHKPFSSWQDSSPHDDSKDATVPAYEADE